MYQAPSQPLINPPIPVIHQIQGGIVPGMIVSVDGVSPPDARNFQINFTDGFIIDGPQRSNVYFHFNPRYDERYVARNTFINGGWEHEEGQQDGKFPFKQGIPFHLMILVENAEYKIAVDGVHFVEYRHRYPIQNINYLQIFGQVFINKVEVHRPPGMAAPQPGFPAGSVPPMGMQPPAVGGHTPVLEQYNPPVPFRQAIPYGVRPGTTFYISARVNQICNRFQINIEKDDVFGSGSPDVLFHFNPRMDGPIPEVVRNTRVSGNWGQEELDIPGFPFIVGGSFDIMLLCEPSRYLVAVNGQHFTAFDHRQPMEQAKNLAVEGDITLTALRITQSPAM